MPHSPEAVVRTWFKEVWDEGREEAIDRLMATDGKVYGLSAAPIVGPTAFKPLFHTFREALGDMAIAIERTVTEGDIVAAYCRVRARHAGHAFGAPPTDRPVDFYGVTICRVRNGQVVEGWNVFDFLTMYQQLGWVKNPPLP